MGKELFYWDADFRRYPQKKIYITKKAIHHRGHREKFELILFLNYEIIFCVFCGFKKSLALGIKKSCSSAYISVQQISSALNFLYRKLLFGHGCTQKVA
jgi:hypothetical protein